MSTKLDRNELENESKTNGQEDEDLRYRRGKDHPNYKHGQSLSAEYRREQIRAWQQRHKEKVKEYQQKSAQKRKSRVASLEARIKELEAQIEAYKEALKAVRGSD